MLSLYLHVSRRFSSPLPTAAVSSPTMPGFLRSPSIQTRLLAGLGLILALMAAMFVVDTVAARVQAALGRRITSRLLPARVAIRSAMQWILRADDDGALCILASGSPSAAPFLQHYRGDLSRVSADLSDAHRLSDLPDKDTLVDAFEQRWLDYRRNNEEAFALAGRGEVKAAREKYVRVPYQPALEVLTRFDRMNSAEIERAQAQDATAGRTAELTGISLNVAALGFGIVVAVRLGSSLRRRIDDVSNAMSEVVTGDLPQITTSFRNIAAGDFTAPRYVCTRNEIAETGGREAARMAATYNRLVRGLGELSFRIGDAATDAQRAREAEARLSYLSSYDETTGLPNREHLREHVESAVEGPARTARFGVASIKLEGFKKIDSSFGREAGRALIQLAAERLVHAARETDVVARGDIDEFFVLLHPLSGPDDAVRVASALRDVVAAPYMLDHGEAFVDATAGLSLFPAHGRNADEILRNAETAAAAARELSSAGPVLFSPAMREHSVERMAVETALQRALPAHEFEVHYQPIVKVDQPRGILGFEALLRWRHPRLGLLQPSSFIPVAEDTGLIESVGAWVLQAACAQTQTWRERGHDVRVSVNVSMRQLRRPDFLRSVRGALHDTGLPPHALELELTESFILKERDTAVRTLSALKSMGVRVAIDDFGTGYSWYGYLRYFSPDSLKIDRSFVSDITSNPFDEAIVNAMIRLGHSLHLNVIAEGVDDAGQLLTLHKLGCDEMQGYLFARPAPAEQCEHLLGDRALLSRLLV